MEQQRESRLYIALRCKDSTIRKKLVDNVMKLPEFEGREDYEDMPLQWLFQWDKSPEGQSYWEDISSDDRDSHWEDTPILDDYKLPNEYWVQGTKSKDNKWKATWKIATDGDTSDGTWYNWYKVTRTGKGTQLCQNSVPHDDLHIIPLDVWYLAVENQYGEKKSPPNMDMSSEYNAGDWVVITDYHIKDLGELSNNWKSNTAYKIDIVDNGYVKKLDGKICCLLFCRFRPATPGEIKKAQRVPLSFKTEDGYTLYEGDMVYWVHTTPPMDIRFGGRTSLVSHNHANDLNGKPWRIFHSKEAAEKWVEKENKKLERINQMPIMPEEAYPKAPEPWSIVTTDGVTLREGDKCWWINSSNCQPFEGSTDNAESSIGHGYKLFSSYEAAEEYRLKAIGEWKDPKLVYYNVGDWIKILDSGCKCSDYRLKEDGPCIIKTNSVVQVIEVDRDIRYSSASYRTTGGWISGAKVHSRLATEDEIPKQKANSPERKWKVGDKFTHFASSPVYTIASIDHDEQSVLIEWKNGYKNTNYLLSKVDELIDRGTWVLCKSENIVTNAVNNINNTNQTKNQENGNQEISSSKQDNYKQISNYQGICIQESTEEVTIICSYYTKGKSLSVCQTVDCITGGQRCSGSTVSC